MTKTFRSTTAPYIVALIGFTSVVVQVLLIRELGVVFYGNELSTGVILGVWLLWTSFGSGVVTRFFRPRRPYHTIGLLQGSLALILPFSLHLIRQSKIILQVTLGEMIGFVPMLIISLLTLAPFCVISGLLYGLSCAWIVPLNGNASKTIGRVYFLEAVGAGIGGLIASFLFIPVLSPSQILILLSFFNLGSALLMTDGRLLSSTAGRLLGLLSLCLLGVLVFSRAERIQANLDRRLWRGYELVGTEASVHGNIAVTRIGDQFSFFQNGLLMFSVPDRLAAEASVHYTLLEHPNPSSALLIGGGLGGALEELFKHPTVETVDYVELDPAIVRIAEQMLPRDLTETLRDSRVTIHHHDGRRFVQSSNLIFDTILLNLPNPYTAQLNRFYTVEFFREIKSRLRSPGIFSLQVASSENAIGPELALFLKTVDSTLREVFPEIVRIPGETLRFIASNTTGILTTDPDTLIARIQERQLRTQYVREYYLPYELSPERTAALDERLRMVRTGKLNTDFKPIGYFHDTMLWATTYSNTFQRIFIRFAQLQPITLCMILCVLTLLATTIKYLKEGRTGVFKIGILASIFAVGFTEISLEVTLILSFQVLFGHVYSHLAVLIAAYMMGLSLGTFTVLRGLKTSHSFRKLRIVQFTMLVFPLFLAGILHLCHGWSLHHGPTWWIGCIFPVITAGAGFIGGIQFPLANHLVYVPFSGKPIHTIAGKLYGLDLLGASMGALFTSAFLIPILGVYTTLFLLSFLNTCGLFMLLVAAPPEFKSP